MRRGRLTGPVAIRPVSGPVYAPAMAIDLATDPVPGAALHDELRRVREAEGPVAAVRFAGRPAWIVTGHAALSEAFRDEAAFPAGEWYRRVIEPIQGRTFESMDGPEHLRVRRLATPAFRSGAVARMEAEGLARLAHESLDAFAGDGAGDLVPLYTARFPFLVISRMLGIPIAREREFVGWAEGILAFDREAARAFTEMLRPVLAARRREPRDDLISLLLASEVEGRRFTDEEVLSHVRLLFSAGATTTHDALATLIWLLHAFPEWADAVRADPATIECVIDELLRWETPVAVLPRLCLPGGDARRCRNPAGVADALRDRRRQPGPDRLRRSGSLRSGPRRSPQADLRTRQPQLPGHLPRAREPARCGARAARPAAGAAARRRARCAAARRDGPRQQAARGRLVASRRPGGSWLLPWFLVAPSLVGRRPNRKEACPEAAIASRSARGSGPATRGTGPRWALRAPASSSAGPRRAAAAPPGSA